MVTINPKVLKGNWTEGFALDLQTLSSEYLGDDEFGHPQFDTKRSELGDLVLKLKYRSDKSILKIVADSVALFITENWKKSKELDIIIPVPPSNVKRSFQPVIVLANELASRLDIPVCSDLKKVRETPEVKNLDEYSSRSEILKDAFKVEGTSINRKTVLLLDDIYRSGETLTAITKVIKEQGKASKVFVLTLTKTRTKK